MRANFYKIMKTLSSQWIKRTFLNFLSSCFCINETGFVSLVSYRKMSLTSELDPSLLELEITETALIKNAKKCINWYGKLREIGIVISIDDFGTGYM